MTIIQEWLEAKEAERNAIEHRRALDAKVAALLPQKNEGTSSGSIEGYKVSVDYKVTRKVDSEKLKFVWANLSESEQDLFRWKAELNMKAFRNYPNNEFINQIVTSKPGAVSVTIEEEEDGN